MKSCAQNIKDSTITPTNVVDGAVGVEKTYWYVAIVNNNSERSIASKLSEDRWKNAYECYVPIQQEQRIWKNGRKNIVNRVLFPAMIFVKCTETDRKSLIVYGIIKSFLRDYAKGKNGTYKIATVPEKQMAMLQTMVKKADSPISIETCHFNIGDSVQIVEGVFKGLEGHIVSDLKGCYLVIEIDNLGYAKVQINPDNLKIEKI